MKFSMRLIRVLFALLLSVSAQAASFKYVPFESGLAFKPSGVIGGSISTAGGGVILRDVAVCNSSNSDVCSFRSVDVFFKQDTGTVQVTFGGNSVATYNADIWVIKSAIDLVAGETKDVFRNINLLGRPTIKEFERLRRHNISPYSVWYVEVSPALAKTKAGETLLTLDLLLTDLQQYATNLGNANNVNRQLQAKGVENWTWTDENAHSSFSVNRTTGELKLNSMPGYTFLDHQKAVIAFPEEFEGLIREINPSLVDQSVEFAKTAAFFRYVRAKYPKDWARIKSASRSLRKTPGETPRLLMR
jgi:hypothetical protein